MDIEERVNKLIEFITKRLRQTRGLDAKKVFLN